jgi:methionyl-tRNA formyltransferase
VLADKGRVVVACGPDGGEAIDLVSVQLEGKKAVSAGEWVGGRGVKRGDRLA